MSISYQIEHEQRKDEAVEICIEIFDRFKLAEYGELPKLMQTAWDIGRKLKLGVK